MYRVGQRISSALESTWELCSAMTHDRDVIHRAGSVTRDDINMESADCYSNESMDLRMLYSTAIIRYKTYMFR